MPRLSAHVTIATTNRWPTTIRIPSSPNGASANASTKTTIGPRLQAIWVSPRSLPLALSGENSPTSASEVGTSAPTAIPTMTVPSKSIGSVDREGDQQGAQGVDQQVVLVDAFATETGRRAVPR